MWESLTFWSTGGDGSTLLGSSLGKPIAARRARCTNVPSLRMHARRHTQITSTWLSEKVVPRRISALRSLTTTKGCLQVKLSTLT